MKKTEMTDSELLVLGLVAEMPRHGYELEQIIEQRTMREWTQIGFSSIYHALGKLEKASLIQAQKPERAKAKKTYLITEAGREKLIDRTIASLTTLEQTYPSVLLGMLHWLVLSREQALDALEQRKQKLALEIERIKGIQLEQQPQPDYVDAVFDYSLSRLKTERDWVVRTLDYMATKPWNS